MGCFGANYGLNYDLCGAATNGVIIEGTHAVQQIMDVGPRDKRARKYELTSKGKITRTHTLIAYGEIILLARGQLLKTPTGESKGKITKVIEQFTKGKITRLYENTADGVCFTNEGKVYFTKTDKVDHKAFTLHEFVATGTCFSRLPDEHVKRLKHFDEHVKATKVDKLKDLLEEYRDEFDDDNE